MSKPLVSIIVPVYNAQNHIARCLESICAQSWQNIEVIVLNDGSKDQSLPVCEAFRAKDERIVLVDKANSGVSDTRNLGLKLASGKYVQFVDSDDWIEPDMYARFAAAITQYAPDMALCEFYYAFADHNEPSTQHLQRAYYTKAQMEREIYPTMLYHAPYYSFGINPCCWSKVFKKELLEQCLYPVTPKVKIGEDAAFTYPCLLAAESLAYVDGCLYHYRNNAQSMTAAFDPHLTETIFIPLDILRTYFDTDKRALFAQYQMYAAYLLQLWVRNQASLDCDLDRKGLRQSCARVCQNQELRALLASVPGALPRQVAVAVRAVQQQKPGQLYLLIKAWNLYYKLRNGRA